MFLLSEVLLVPCMDLGGFRLLVADFLSHKLPGYCAVIDFVPHRNSIQILLAVACFGNFWGVVLHVECTGLEKNRMCSVRLWNYKVLNFLPFYMMLPWTDPTKLWQIQGSDTWLVFINEQNATASTFE